MAPKALTALGCEFLLVGARLRDDSTSRASLVWYELVHVRSWQHDEGAEKMVTE